MGEDGGGVNEAEQDVLSFINAQARNGVKVSAKYLTERFTMKPYGWPTTAVLCFAGSLVAKGKIEARVDSTVTEGLDLAKALSNSHALPNILLTPQAEFSAAQIRKAKDLYQELFSKPAGGTDARSIGAEWAASVEELEAEVDDLTRQKHDYPFMTALEPFRDRLQAMKGKPAVWYITEPAKAEDELLDAKEDVHDKIKSFMAGAQKGIYDDARGTLTRQGANLDYVDPEAAQALRSVLNDPECYKGTAIQSLKTDLYNLKNKVDHKVLEERKAVEAAVDEVAAKVTQMAEFQALPEQGQQQITTRINTRKTGLDRIDLIPVLRDRSNDIRYNLLAEVIGEIDRMNRPAPAPTPSGVSEAPAPAPQAPSYVNATQVKVSFDKPYLADDADVDAYVEELKKTLLAEIHAGKKVIV